ncbi:carboxypeptidase regulatory-like domain-containing protein [Arthrobacter glacialis]|uniref:carboxypeptidase regulatory-like domain-containing protein n=1 Tax=Arthrobacter glacialis TaxID=1664 RepID=UPI000CD47BB8|nr:carboxypeptidase regulatory-like domain-containing protein [Arthrobacter glacialis]POH61182.1 hypothetical protein CVS28_01420 [Arthrobacter glacialis]
METTLTHGVRRRPGASTLSLIAAVVIVLGMLLPSAGVAQAATSYTVSGTVTAKASATAAAVPLANVFVELLPQTPSNGTRYYASTNAAGQYSITAPGIGDYKVWFSCGDEACRAKYSDIYYGNSVSNMYGGIIKVTAAQPAARANAELGAYATLKGRTTNAAGTPVGSIGVVAQGAGGTSVSAISDTNGYFTLAKVVPGLSQVVARDSTLQSRFVTQYWSGTTGTDTASNVTIAPGASLTNVNFKLNQATSIAAKATDAAGKALPHIGYTVLTLNPTTGKWEQPQVMGRALETDASGMAYFTPEAGKSVKFAFIDNIYEQGAATPSDRYATRWYNNASTEASATILKLTQGQRVSFTMALPSAGKSLTPAYSTTTGTGKVGTNLSINPGAWGPAPVAYSYQWQRNGVAIAGATAASYLLAAADLGTLVNAKITVAKTGYATAVVPSDPYTVTVGTLSAPAPAITGTKKVGSTLTAVPGTWGPAPVTLKYQWYSSGTAIAGATASSYTLVTLDKGKSLTVKVTGSKTGYTTAAKTSAAYGAIL